jgi:hypothetical protein
MNVASPAPRLALADASEAYCKRIRARFGLTPEGAPADPTAMPGLAYCGREFRAYPSMRIADAIRFYATLHARWNDARLRESLALAGLDERFEIGRMKRAFQRALVLAFALASEPVVLVVENAEEFDEERAHALLARAVGLVPRAIVTYGVNVTHQLAGLPDAIDAAAFDPESL